MPDGTKFFCQASSFLSNIPEKKHNQSDRYIRGDVLWEKLEWERPEGAAGALQSPESTATCSPSVSSSHHGIWAFHFWSPVVQSIHLGYKDPKSHSPLPWQQHMLLGIVKSCHEFSHFSLQLAINVQTFSPGLRNVTDMADISV